MSGHGIPEHLYQGAVSHHSVHIFWSCYGHCIVDGEHSITTAKYRKKEHTENML